MSTSRFDTTIHALEGGPQQLGPEKGIKNIEGWEEYLSKHDHEGVKAVVADLGKLKKLLHAGTPDSAAIKKLLDKLSKDTVKVAGEDTSAGSSKIKQLGEALSK